MTLDVNAQHEKFVKAGGVFALEKGVLQISGKDACDFLHRMTTQDVKNLAPGQGSAAAILQANAMIVAFFNLYNHDGSFLIVADKKMSQVIVEHLEKFHFAEALEIKNVSGEFKFLSVQGSRGVEALKEFVPQLPRNAHEISSTEIGFVLKESDFLIPGFHLLVEKDKSDEILSELKSKQFDLLGLDLWRLLRLEAGFFEFGLDVTEKNLILEAPVADAVSRNKGCYPGQEVVERVFTYGNVAKKLVGLEWSASPPKESPVKLFVDGKEVGVATSFQEIPWNGKYFGFAVVRKPHYEAGQKLSLAHDDVQAKVVLLPHHFEIHRELKG